MDLSLPALAPESTPPYETVDSLRKRLQGMYAQADVGSLKSIAWFICRKAD